MLLLFSCTDDEGVKFQPDEFFLNATLTSVNESDGDVTVTFNTSRTFASDLLINYTLTGSAENGVDYSGATGSITIPAGSEEASLVITLIDDNLIEPQENIIITVTDTSNSQLFIDQSDVITLTIIDDESIAYQNGILVTNEGNGAPGTIAFIDNELTAVSNQIYNAVNAEDAGNGVRSISFNNEKAYIVATGSNKITVINRYSFLKESEITTGLNNPRYMTVIGTNGYVTNWGDPAITTDDFIAIIDLDSNTVSGTIPVSEGPEKMVVKSNKLYVSHTGGNNYNNIITMIENDAVSGTITVGDVPNNMVLDPLFNIWVMCEGKPASSGDETGGKLIKINTSDDTIATTLDFAVTDHPTGIGYESEEIYYHLNGAVYKMNETDTALPTTSIITTPAYGFALDNGKLYTTDAVDNMSNGTIKVFDLTDNSELGMFTVGVNPGGIFFNN